MINEIKEHLAQLAIDLNVTVYYKMDFSCDSLKDIWPSFRERHEISSTDYQTINRVNFKQILSLTKDDFIKRVD